MVQRTLVLSVFVPLRILLWMSICYGDFQVDSLPIFWLVELNRITLPQIMHMTFPSSVVWEIKPYPSPAGFQHLVLTKDDRFAAYLRGKDVEQHDPLRLDHLGANCQLLCPKFLLPMASSLYCLLRSYKFHKPCSQYSCSILSWSLYELTPFEH